MTPLRRYATVMFYLSLIALISYETGFIRGVEALQPQVTIQVNPVVVSASTLNNQLNLAASQLVNCPALRTTYPSKVRQLVTIGTIGFSYAERPSPLQDAYAVTLRSQKTIILTPHYFELTYKEQVAVLGHELLHVIGIPRNVWHNTALYPRYPDAVHRITAACFPEAP